MADPINTSIDDIRFGYENNAVLLNGWRNDLIRIQEQIGSYVEVQTSKRDQVLGLADAAEKVGSDLSEENIKFIEYLRAEE